MYVKHETILRCNIRLFYPIKINVKGIFSSQNKRNSIQRHAYQKKTPSLASLLDQSELKVVAMIDSSNLLLEISVLLIIGESTL